MKIYFCGSVQGGRQDAELYTTIIDELKSNYGQVLTEYVGSLTAPQDEMNLGHKATHQLCLNKLTECDVLVAEVTQPSLGVGYEIGRAVAMNKKILCLFRPTSGKKLSCMIDGLDDEQNVVVIYYEEKDLKDILKSYFQKL